MTQKRPGLAPLFPPWSKKARAVKQEPPWREYLCQYEGAPPPPWRLPAPPCSASRPAKKHTCGKRSFGSAAQPATNRGDSRAERPGHRASRAGSNLEDMDDIADIHFMDTDSSFIGRHHVQKTFHHRHIEDQLASTAIPSLGGYGIEALEPFESQERGFQHGHCKKYATPKNNERAISEKFRAHNETELHNLFQDLESALIRCADTLQYEASTLPAKHMGQTVLPKKFTAKPTSSKHQACNRRSDFQQWCSGIMQCA